MIARYRMRNFLTPDDPKSTAEVLREMEEADPETFLAGCVFVLMGRVTLA